MSKKRISIESVMKRTIDFVDGNETVASALLKMQHTDTHALIINKRDEHDEYGIVLLADIAKKVLAQDRAPDRVNVYEIMSKPVLCVSAKMDIRYCARLFERFDLHLAPVTENGKLVGVVSYNDMVLNGLVNLLE